MNPAHVVPMNRDGCHILFLAGTAQSESKSARPDSTKHEWLTYIESKSGRRGDFDMRRRM